MNRFLSCLVSLKVTYQGYSWHKFATDESSPSDVAHRSGFLAQPAEPTRGFWQLSRMLCCKNDYPTMQICLPMICYSFTPKITPEGQFTNTATKLFFVVCMIQERQNNFLLISSSWLIYIIMTMFKMVWKLSWLSKAPVIKIRQT